jgi:hypothetical protein
MKDMLSGQNQNQKTDTQPTVTSGVDSEGLEDLKKEIESLKNLFNKLKNEMGRSINDLQKALSEKSDLNDLEALRSK